MTTIVKSKTTIVNIPVEVFELQDTDYTILHSKEVEVTLDMSPTGNHKSSRLSIAVDGNTFNVTYSLLMDLKKSFNTELPYTFEVCDDGYLTIESAQTLYLKLEEIIKTKKVSLTILN